MRANSLGRSRGTDDWRVALSRGESRARTMAALRFAANARTAHTDAVARFLSRRFRHVRDVLDVFNRFLRGKPGMSSMVWASLATRSTGSMLGSDGRPCARAAGARQSGSRWSQADVAGLSSKGPHRRADRVLTKQHTEMQSRDFCRPRACGGFGFLASSPPPFTARASRGGLRECPPLALGLTPVGATA